MENTPLKLESSWDDVKEYLKELNIDLTDQDLQYEPGQEEALLERLQPKMGKSKAEIRALIESVSYTKGIAG